MTTVAVAGRGRVPTRVIWLGGFVLALALYSATANRGAQWQDSGWQQLRIVTGEPDNRRGLALTHPLQYFLGRAAIRLPISEPGFAITLVSSLAAAIAVANLAATIHLLTRCASAGVIASAAFMLSHTFWQHATHTESYALAAALLTTEWLCLAAYLNQNRNIYLLLLALTNGVGIANHLLAALATPVDVAILVWAIHTRRLTAAKAVCAAGLWLLGTMPYALLVIARAVQAGDLTGVLHSALFGDYAAAVLNMRMQTRTLLLAIGFVAYNLPGLTVPLAVYALLARPRQPKVLYGALACQLLLFTLFVVRYDIVDQYTFYFPVYALLALLSGLGLARALATSPAVVRRVLLIGAAVTALWTPAVYWTAMRVCAARGAFSSLVGRKPYRDGYRAFFVPWGLTDNAPDELNRAIADRAGNAGLVLVADHMIIFGVRYAQAVGQVPPAVEILRIDRNETAEQLAARRAKLRRALEQDRPVVLVPRDRDNPTADIPRARWQRHGDIYCLRGLDKPARAYEEVNPAVPVDC